jgi:N-dimethylarginine dimethylaminohydrolase
MERKETIELLKAVTTYYPNFKMDDPKATLDAWHNILQEFEFESIQANLMAFVKISRFAPSVADLVHVQSIKERIVPDYEETKQMIRKWDEEKANKAGKEVVEQHLAEIRKILGINRG